MFRSRCARRVRIPRSSRVRPLGAAAAAIVLWACGDRSPAGPTLTSQELESRLQGAYRQYREVLVRGWDELSKKANVAVASTASAEVISDEPWERKRPGVRALVAAALEAEGLTKDRLAKGVDLALAALQLPAESQVPSGAYVLRVLPDPVGRDRWRAEFRGLDGRVFGLTSVAVAEAACDPCERVEIAVERIERGSPERLRVALSSAMPTPGRATVVQLTLDLGTGRREAIPPTAPGADLLAAAESYERTLDQLVQNAAEWFGGKAESEWIHGGTGESSFIVVTVFRGLSPLSLDDLAKGKDMFLGYFPSMTVGGAKLAAGFYKVQVMKAGATWRADFFAKEAPGSPPSRKASTTDRVIIEPMPAETKAAPAALAGGSTFDGSSRMFRIAYQAPSPDGTRYALCTYTFTADRIREE